MLSENSLRIILYLRLHSKLPISCLNHSLSYQGTHSKQFEGGFEDISKIKNT